MQVEDRMAGHTLRSSTNQGPGLPVGWCLAALHRRPARPPLAPREGAIVESVNLMCFFLVAMTSACHLIVDLCTRFRMRMKVSVNFLAISSVDEETIRQGVMLRRLCSDRVERPRHAAQPSSFFLKIEHLACVVCHALKRAQVPNAPIPWMPTGIAMHWNAT